MSTSDLRDLRSDAQDAKRDRDHKQKWAHGGRPLPGVRRSMNVWSHVSGVDDDGRVRPEKLWTGYRQQTHNVSKLTRPMAHIDMPQSRFRAHLDARVQLSDPNNLIDYLSEDMPGARDVRSPTDGFLYSFDRTDTPGRPLSLEMFVKENPRATRATERLVENEYEIVDSNGDALQGRRARNMLRRQNNGPVEEHSELAREDDGFELI
ncbi:uncharacterized protein B0I36DRAFT_347451 [Microdochium trichocladiopsis]|uniref:Uncharacterized protein n=1 Tax=Microdochium trichocladiopsis TaxID=1682393 RepID=A0A9P9BTK8_9PEZI|nr:uncharacterized protein B0I36DRAFT_347451 [Microdochium trichocladiopsis]KAH7035714.1 hypothetical protein B0I36DRAFT_347451 [Microdochium trichocladiopsis]